MELQEVLGMEVWILLEVICCHRSGRALTGKWNQLETKAGRKLFVSWWRQLPGPGAPNPRTLNPLRSTTGLAALCEVASSACGRQRNWGSTSGLEPSDDLGCEVFGSCGFLSLRTEGAGVLCGCLLIRCMQVLMMVWGLVNSGALGWFRKVLSSSQH